MAFLQLRWWYIKCQCTKRISISIRIWIVVTIPNPNAACESHSRKFQCKFHIYMLTSLIDSWINLNLTYLIWIQLKQRSSIKPLSKHSNWPLSRRGKSTNNSNCNAWCKRNNLMNGAVTPETKHFEQIKYQIKAMGRVDHPLPCYLDTGFNRLYTVSKRGETRQYSQERNWRY